jgi:hypothetical protein
LGERDPAMMSEMLTLLLLVGFGGFPKQPPPPTVLHPPVTIEVRQDVEVVQDALKQVRGKLYVLLLGAEPFWIRKGQRFEMIEEHGEGECRIRFEGKEYLASSCPWLEGFTDHQREIFQVVAKPKRKTP